MLNSDCGMKTGPSEKTTPLAWLLFLVSLPLGLAVSILRLAAYHFRWLYRIHAPINALVRPQDHGLSRFLDCFVDHRLFARFEPAQHVINCGFVMLKRRTIHTDAEPGIFGGAQLLLNTPQPVVPAGRA